METKACELAVKHASEGKVVATLARLGVRDRDGDILRKGLVGTGQLVAIKPQHKWDHVDLGVAKVYETAHDTLEADMEFNLAIPAAKDWFEAIKFSHARGRRQQYSFGFEVMEFERGMLDGKSIRYLNRIELAEASPVLIGASVGSETLRVKAWEPSDEEKQEGVQIQTLIFKKSKWDSAEAVRSWLSSHDFKTGLADFEDTWHAEQRAAGDFVRLRSFCINPSRDASPDECRVMARGGPVKSSASSDDGQERKRPTIREVLHDIDSLIAHFTYLQHVRNRNGKTLAQETLNELDQLTQKVIAFRVLLNLKAIEAENPIGTIYHEREKSLREETQAREAAAKAEQQAVIAQLRRQFEARQAFIEQQKSRV
jgi:hypothetical protein